MDKLTLWERRVISVLLRRASDEFSNHGCNEFDVAKTARITPEECKALWEQLAEWDDPDLAEREGPVFWDWHLMQFFADKLGG